MSVLVWDGATLACDCSANDGAVRYSIDKMWRVQDGKGGYVYMGGVGAVHDISVMKEWAMGGRVPDKFPNVSNSCTFVIVTISTGLIRYTTKPVGIVHGFNKCAFGSGRDFAYGALHHGANAVDAVRAAIRFSQTCGANVSIFEVVKQQCTTP